MRTIRFAVLLVAFFILGVMLSIPKAHAATCTWDGSNSTWETASHWSCGHVPASGDNVNIPSGTVTVTANEDIGTGDIDNSGTLIVNAGVTLNFHNLDNLSGGTITNKGTMAVNGIGDITNDSGGTFANSGTISVYNLNNSGTFANSGTITTVSNGDVSNLTGGTFTNSGMVTVTDHSRFFSNAGTVSNFGTISAGHIENDGVITNCGGIITFYVSFTGNPIINCVVGGEVLSLDYGSLMFSAVPWILIVALAAAAAIVLRQKFKLLL